MRTIKSAVVFLFLLIFAFNIWAEGDLSEIKVLLEKGVNEYENPDTQSLSIVTFNSVLDRIRLLPEGMSSSDEVKAVLKKTYEYKGLAHFNRGEKDKAEKSFTMLIMLDPLATLDEDLLSPKITNFFKKIKNQLVGYLTVTAIPAASDVYVDGEFFGITPVYSKEIFAGNHKLTVKHKGYDVIQKDFTVEAGSKVEILDVTLQLISGICYIRTSPSGVKVFLDDELQGITQRKEIGSTKEDVGIEERDIGEIKLEYVSTGVHELKLQKDCYLDNRAKIKVIIGDNQYPTFTLELAKAKISVSCRTDGNEVFLDDEYFGITPIKGESLCAGEYAIKVIFPNKRLFVARYLVKKDDDIKIFAEPKPTIAFLGFYSAQNGEYMHGESVRFAESMKDLEDLTMLSLSSTRKTLKAEKISLGDKKNFIISEESGVILQIKDEFAKKLFEKFYCELFVFGLVESQRGLSSDATLYLFSIHERKPDFAEISLSEFSSYKTIKDKLLRKFNYMVKDIGVSYMDNEMAEGPVICEILKSESGDLKVGDVILSIDGKPIKSSASLRDYLNSLEEGKKMVELAIMRDGSKLTKEIRLGTSRNDLPIGGYPYFYNKIIVDLLIQLNEEGSNDVRDLLNYNLALSFIHFKSWEKALIFLSEVTDPSGEYLPNGVVDFYKGICYQKLGKKEKAIETFEKASKDEEATLFYAGGPQISPIASYYIASLEEERVE